MDISDLIALVEKYKNINIVLHISSKDRVQYAYVFDEFIRLSSQDVLDRLIFQPTYFYEDIYIKRKNKIKNFMIFVRKQDFEDMDALSDMLKKYDIKRIVTHKNNRHKIKELKKINKELCVQIYPEESIFNILKFIFRYKADLVVTHGDFKF